MFKLLVSETHRPFLRVHLSLLLLLAFASYTRAQGNPEVVWQTNSGASAIAFSADGKLLLTGTRLWEADNGTLVRTFTLPYNGGGVKTVALSPDGEFAAIGIQGFNQNLDLFRVSDGALLRGRITAHTNGTTSVAFSPDGQFLASGGRDGTAKLWHLPEMTRVRTFNETLGYQPRVFAVAFSRDGGTLAVGGQAGVQLFGVANGQLIRQLTGAAATLSLAFSPDNQFVSAGSDQIDQQGQCTDCSIKTWRIADGALLQTIDGGNNGVISLAFSPDQQVIAEGAGDRISDGVVNFWRLSDGALLTSFNQDSAYITSVAYSPDGSLFAFGRVDGHVIVARNPFATCSCSLASSRQTFPASGGRGSVNVNVSGSCDWQATSNASWITFRSSESGTGSSVLNFSVAENSTGRRRSGTITVGDQTLTIAESGGRVVE